MREIVSLMLITHYGISSCCMIGKLYYGGCESSRLWIFGLLFESMILSVLTAVIMMLAKDECQLIIFVNWFIISATIFAVIKL